MITKQEKWEEEFSALWKKSDVWKWEELVSSPKDITAKGITLDGLSFVSAEKMKDFIRFLLSSQAEQQRKGIAKWAQKRMPTNKKGIGNNKTEAFEIGHIQGYRTALQDIITKLSLKD